MASIGIIDASPLILFSRSSHFELLSHFASTILVPQLVADEIMARGPTDPTVRVLGNTPWLRIVASPAVPEVILDWGLGPGESGVLAYALAHAGTEAIIDDLHGRRCATVLGIPVRGTLGIVLAARKRGLISLARPVMEDLIGAGLYLSREVLDDALRRVGE